METMREVQEFIKTKGRADIAAGGFGKRWQNTFRVDLKPERGSSLNAAVWVYHKIPYAGIFEEGGRIHGKPMLWVPLSNIPPRIGARRMTPYNFTKEIGPLHSRKRGSAGPPLLFAYVRGKRVPKGKISLSALRAGSALARLGVRSRRGGFGGAGVVSVPVFIGLSEVHLRKRFHLRVIYEQGRKMIPATYAKHLNRQNLKV